MGGCMTKRIEDLPIGAKVVCNGFFGTIVARVPEARPTQQLVILSENGNIHTAKMDGTGNGINQMWIPAKEKRSGWMNVYANSIRVADDPTNRGSMIWDTKEQADQAIGANGRIDCIQVEWEE